MRYKDRTQLVREQLTEDFFQSIIAYRFCRSSGMGGPGCVIMVAENGRSYQFLGTELDRLNYARGEWRVVFPILRNANGWKVVTCKGDQLYFRQDKYSRIIQCIDEAKGKIERIWEDAAVKVALLDTAKTPEERRIINRTHELRQPLYRYGDLVRFTYTNGKKEWPCRGRICTVDIYRDAEQKTSEIEYDIDGADYSNPKKSCTYKHIEENNIISTAPGSVMILSGFSEIGTRAIRKRMEESSPGKYLFVDGQQKQNVIEKEIFRGKKIVMEILPQGIQHVKEKYPDALRIFLCPESYEELLGGLQDSAVQPLRVKLQKCLEEMPLLEEYHIVLWTRGTDSATTAGILDMISEIAGDLEKNAADETKKLKLDALRKEIEKALQ